MTRDHLTFYSFGEALFPDDLINSGTGDSNEFRVLSDGEIDHTAKIEKFPSLRKNFPEWSAKRNRKVFKCIRK